MVDPAIVSSTPGEGGVSPLGTFELRDGLNNVVCQRQLNQFKTATLVPATSLALGSTPRWSGRSVDPRVRISPRTRWRPTSAGRLRSRRLPPPSSSRQHLAGLDDSDEPHDGDTSWIEVVRGSVRTHRALSPARAFTRAR
jgi:hypothetical protein